MSLTKLVNVIHIPKQVELPIANLNFGDLCFWEWNTAVVKEIVIRDQKGIGNAGTCPGHITGVIGQSLFTWTGTSVNDHIGYSSGCSTKISNVDVGIDPSPQAEHNPRRCMRHLYISAFCFLRGSESETKGKDS